jgi:thioester reductase-like protein
MAALNGTTLLVTGASGFLCSYFQTELLRRGDPGPEHNLCRESF